MLSTYKKLEVIYICKNQKRSKGGCNARLRKNKETNGYRKDGHAHNHPTENQTNRHVSFVNECCGEATTSRELPREIFNTIRRNYPGLPVTYNEAMRRRIQRAKRNIQPKIPKSILEAEELLKQHLVYT